MLFSISKDRRYRGYFTRVPSFDLDGSKECNDVSTPENSMSDGMSEGQKEMETKRSTGHLVAAIPWILVALLVSCQIVGVVLVWSGKVLLVLYPNPRLPPPMQLDTPINFVEYEKYAGWAPDHGMPAWKQQTANLDIGRVFVKDPSQYGLIMPDWPPDEGGFTEYPVALYHQLHCLGTIREVFYTLNISEAVAYGGHVGHCFDYLRQSLWCAGDLTLEYTGVGWGVEHLCKDPREMAGFMQQFDR